MNKTELENLYLELFSKLWNNFMFYISKDIFDLDLINKIEDIENVDMLFDKLLIFDQAFGVVEFNPKKDNTKYLKKPGELSEIIFYLLEHKSKSKDYELSYIIDKYYEQAECLFYLTKLLNSNVHSIEKLDIQTKGIFSLQYMFYKKHLEEFIRNFYPSQKDLPSNKRNTLNLIETNFKSVSDNINIVDTNKESQIKTDRVTEIINIFKNHKLNKDLNNASVVQKRAPLITEKEAEEALLKSIFNISK